MKPRTATSPPPGLPDNVSSGVPSRRSSIASLDDLLAPSAHTGDSAKPSNLDYNKLFPSFFVHPYTVVAPANRFLNQRPNPEFSAFLESASEPRHRDDVSSLCTSHHFRGIFKRRESKRKINHARTRTARTIIDRIQEGSVTPIDLTGTSSPARLDSLLNRVQLKVFSFHEDVRPGYQGTYTQPVSPRTGIKLSRKPFERALPNKNYDYDSEAEWEPPEEGDEDLDAMDEQSGDEDDEEDMADFLDDEDDVGKRRLVVSDMEPQCSGLCWEGQDKKANASRGFNMAGFRMEIIAGKVR